MFSASLSVPPGSPRRWRKASAAVAAGERDEATAIANIAPSTEEAQRRLQVAQLYLALLDRNPALQEIDFWVAQMRDHGKTREQVAAGILTSQEATKRYPNQTADGFLDHLYSSILNRAPDEPGRQFWKNKMSGTPPMSREQVVLAILDTIAYSTATDSATLTSKAWFNTKVADALNMASEEAKAIIVSPATTGAKLISISLAEAAAEAASFDAAYAVTPAQYRYTQVVQAYALLLNRAPDLAGLNNWVGLMNQGRTVAEVAQGLISSTEWHDLIQSDPSPSGVLTRIYREALGRQPQASELSNWVARLNAAPSQQGAVYADLLQSVLGGQDGGVAAQISTTLFRNQVAQNLQTLAAEAAEQEAIYKVKLAVDKATAKVAAEIAALTLPEPAVVRTAGQSGTLVDGATIRTTPVIHQAMDRWGNVLEITDARNPNWKTTYK